MKRDEPFPINPPPSFLGFAIRGPWLWQIRTWLAYIALFALASFAIAPGRRHRWFWLLEVTLASLLLACLLLDHVGRLWLDRRRSHDHWEHLRSTIQSQSEHARRAVGPTPPETGDPTG